MDKKCSRCQQRKAHSEFYGNVAQKDGYHGSCKVCERSQSRSYYEKNKDIICAKKQQKKKKNARPPKNNERIIAMSAGLKHYFNGKPCRNGHISQRYVSDGHCFKCQRDNGDIWHRTNPTKQRGYASLCYSRHREKRKETTRIWAKQNPEAVRSYAANRRSAMKGCVGAHTGEQVKNLYRNQGGLCVYCRKKLENRYHKDHIKPVSKSGDNWITNIQLLCPKCNFMKNNKDPILFAQQVGFLL